MATMASMLARAARSASAASRASRAAALASARAARSARRAAAAAASRAARSSADLPLDSSREAPSFRCDASMNGRGSSNIDTPLFPDDKLQTPVVDQFVADEKDLESDEALWALYERWCKHFNQERDRDEMARRFNEFKGLVLFVHQENNSGRPYKLGINQFTDGKLSELCLGDNNAFHRKELAKTAKLPKKGVCYIWPERKHGDWFAYPHRQLRRAPLATSLHDPRRRPACLVRSTPTACAPRRRHARPSPLARGPALVAGLHALLIANLRAPRRNQFSCVPLVIGQHACAAADANRRLPACPSPPATRLCAPLVTGLHSPRRRPVWQCAWRAPRRRPVHLAAGLLAATIQQSALFIGLHALLVANLRALAAVSLTAFPSSSASKSARLRVPIVARPPASHRWPRALCAPLAAGQSTHPL
ncbi:hypothetical protein ACP4OV_031092 [Aristida adscensionis]